MKILVTQLARFGDLYQSWPTLRALHRKFPKAELHLLVRKRFAAAVEGLGIDCRVHTMDTGEILGPIYSTRADTDEAMARLSQFVEALGENQFDEIINLSFSPFSSFLTHFLTSPKTRVRGYTRHQDGFLAIPDDASAYFYAQVGVGRSNRVHLTELFASIAEVDLIDQDWLLPDYQRNSAVKDRIFAEHGLPTDDSYLVLHVGASEVRKTLSPGEWAAAARQLLQWWKGRIVLVGSPDEVLLGQRILEGACSNRVHSLVGKTRLPELFSIIASARLVVGGDSVVMQMATLAQVECFNISFPSVNFWETGPREAGSRILLLNPQQPPSPEVVAKEIWHAIEGLAPNEPTAFASGDSPVCFLADQTTPSEEFSWELIRAIYLSAEFPVLTSSLAYLGFQRLHELAELALKQIEATTREGSRAVAIEILNQVDSLVGSVRRMVPELDPLISWLETEKIRIPPSEMNELAERTRKLFATLKMVAELYIQSEAMRAEPVEAPNANDSLVS
ncbi:MAG: glycosyltransferase family 9 protein [Bdellovibrionales bacterium]|nr:glycosyltransferase family 9 protein [Bdellovibrionales bacterium]